MLVYLAMPQLKVIGTYRAELPPRQTRQLPRGPCLSGALRETHTNKKVSQT